MAPGCARGFGAAVTLDEATQSLQDSTDPLWSLVRSSATSAAASEPQLASELYGNVLAHDSLDDVVATVLANALNRTGLQATQLLGLFRSALENDESYRASLRADLAAVMERDPAAPGACGVLLYSKGWQALQCYRLAHWLWRNERHALALYLQSTISAAYAVDIHPAARIGRGVFVDHATGIVIGETAVLGDNVSILQNVTLGGTGKEKGDRHPKVADGVMIGAGATVLGNIRIGEGAHIAACSVVLKPVPPAAVMSGVPAKIVGNVTYNKGVFPSFVMDQRLSVQLQGPKNAYQDVVADVKASDEYSGFAI